MRNSLAPPTPFLSSCSGYAQLDRNMLLLELFILQLLIGEAASIVSSGNEAVPSCEKLRSKGAAPTPAYSANMRVLMDSWNYQNLLPPRNGAVWDQVDNDANNPVELTTNVSQRHYVT